MRRQKAALEARIERYRDVVRSLDTFLHDQEHARRIMAQSSFPIEEKDTPALTIASIRMKGRYSDCGAAFGRIGKRFGRFVRGKPLLLQHDAEYREDDADFEACLPIEGAESADGISVKELPAARCVTLIHKGPYEDLGRSCARVLDYVRAKGYEILMPTREVYHKGPGMIFRGNPRNYLTEIQIPIAGEAASEAVREALRTGCQHVVGGANPPGIADATTPSGGWASLTGSPLRRVLAGLTGAAHPP